MGWHVDAGAAALAREEGTRAPKAFAPLPGPTECTLHGQPFSGMVGAPFRFLDTGRRPENGLARSVLQAHSADGARRSLIRLRLHMCTCVHRS